MFACKVLKFITSPIHHDLYGATGTKMAETGYQYDDCDHIEITQNVCELFLHTHVLFYERLLTNLELEIGSGEDRDRPTCD